MPIRICCGHLAFTIAVVKPERGGRTLKRYRRTWEDNIKLDLSQIGLEEVN